MDFAYIFISVYTGIIINNRPQFRRGIRHPEFLSNPPSLTHLRSPSRPYVLYCKYLTSDVLSYHSSQNRLNR